jgi:hypothetical protein
MRLHVRSKCTAAKRFTALMLVGWALAAALNAAVAPVEAHGGVSRGGVVQSIEAQVVQAESEKAQSRALGRSKTLQSQNGHGDTLKVAEATVVDSVWSALPVGFSLLTYGNRQFVAYYDSKRRLTVASRTLGSKRWRRVRLGEKVPWDSHNYVTMAVDEKGHLHLSGNMHVDPLVYYRSQKPLDIGSLKRIDEMVGRNEEQCTYPAFFKGPGGTLIFGYRDGQSGKGKRIYNAYNAEKEEWRRLLDTPLLDGTSQDMNAYPLGPKKGPDGQFHLVWMWRNTPDAATNHHLSYTKSTDLRRWETAGGEPVSLPVTPADTGVVVDPVGPREGLINMGFALGFDNQNRPVVSYHKYDENGNSQIYNARWEGDTWQIYKTSDWNVRWDFGGGGSIPSRVGAEAIRPVDKEALVEEAAGEETLAQSYWHWKKGEGTWLLNPETLRPVGQASLGAQRPARLGRVRSTFPGMRVQWASDAEKEGPKEANVRYQLRWETLGPNRDQPREGKVPSPSTLEVYKFVNPTD